MDKECRDLLKKEGRTPRKGKKPADAASNSAEKGCSDKENEGGVNNPKEDSERDLSPSKTDTSNQFAHPVYKKISTKNGCLNRLDLSSLKSLCKAENIDSSGRRGPVTKRLKQYYKTTLLREAGLLEVVNRGFDFLVVVDFEATCEDKNSSDYPHEIIEFPAVLIDVASCKIVESWRKFVRPVIQPTLSDFCTSLTGITQDVVDAGDSFPSVLESFNNWLRSNRLGVEHTFALVTDGPFDVGRFLRLSCQQNNLEVPAWASRWINLRKGFANFYRTKSGGAHDHAPGLHTMLTKLGLKFQGSPHCGLDDATNIGRVAERLLRDGANLRVNERLHQPGETPDKERRLQHVVPVSRREADDWFTRCKRELVVTKNVKIHRTTKASGSTNTSSYTNISSSSNTNVNKSV